jgi:general transcription factor 3C polypeptide 5 (transcription factor C subunit 1)
MLKNFNFVPGIDKGPNVDIIPPPSFTSASLPFNYSYSQNPYVHNEYDEDQEEIRVVNSQMPFYVGHFISAEEYPIPAGPQAEPNMDDPDIYSAVTEMRRAMKERPIWTRRAIVNRVGLKLANLNVLKRCIGFVGYQFKGGPWRDAIIKYGVDPRSNRKYRIYQTLLFKLRRKEPGRTGHDWRDIRREEIQTQEFVIQNKTSHIFDGKSYYADGKIWQICDITDPVLEKLLRDAESRPTCELKRSGWYHGGTWAKVKGIMKHKLMAIQFGRHFTAREYHKALEMGDRTPPRSSGGIHIPLPDLNLTVAELQAYYGRKYKQPKTRRNPIYMRFGRHDQRKGGPGAASEGTSSDENDPDREAQKGLPGLAGRTISEDDSDEESEVESEGEAGEEEENDDGLEGEEESGSAEDGDGDDGVEEDESNEDEGDEDEEPSDPEAGVEDER